jgi:hypothetical protein
MYQRLSDFQVGISPGLLPAFVLQIKPSFGIIHIFVGLTPMAQQVKVLRKNQIYADIQNSWPVLHFK